MMATIRYFTTCQTTEVELTRVYHDGAVSGHATHFMGTCPACGRLHPCTRKIVRPSRPRNHPCGGRCQSAKRGDCECACGGVNHGILS